MRKRLISILGIVIAAAMLGNHAYCAYLEENAEQVNLYVGDVKTFPVNVPTRIVIGKPEVADVTQVTDAEITLVAKAAGTTTFVLWDNFGEQDFQLTVFAEDMKAVKMRLDNILKELGLPNVYTKAIDSESKVLLLGEVKTPQERERFLTALAPLKDRIVDLVKIKEEESVIDIDVQVLELNKDATNTLGFTWPGAVSISTDFPAGTPTTGIDPVSRSTFFNLTQWSRSNFEWKLDLLIQEGKARVLSRPRLACQSGKEAELMVGGEQPILTSQAIFGAGTTTTIEYKEFGIKLKIKPSINDETRIKLGVKVEVSDIGVAEVLGPANAPIAKAWPLSKRTASTELFLTDGQTLAIGGLIKQKTEEDLSRMPWLCDVPVLGIFFRNKETKVGGGRGTLGNTELFITITPKIIGKVKEVKQEPKIAAVPSVNASPYDPVVQYAGIVERRVLENIRYPQAAKDAGFEGTVKLGLLLSYQGALLQAKIKESSGYQVLDDYTLKIVREITSYPPFPPSIESKELWLDIPVSYKPD
ncbi:MAG: TonB family protein [Deltaproteobacteria bacterium]